MVAMNSLRSTTSVEASPRSEQVAAAMKRASTVVCPGAQLSYHGHIPLLTITAATPKEAGYAQGYLLAEPIYQLIDAVTSDIIASIQLPKAVEPTWKSVSKMLSQAQIDKLWNQIPEVYQNEIDGVVEGYNKRLEEGAFTGEQLSRNDVVLFHMMPDKQHYDLFKNLISVAGVVKEVAKGLFSKLFGCTTVIGGDKETGPIFGRNLDWPSYGCLADASMIISRKSYTNGKCTIEVGLPGFIGTLTGMNEDGLSLAMNVCDGETKEIKGMLAGFYNRSILETCDTVAKVQEFVKNTKPLGPYHLTVADPQDAAICHLKQAAGDASILRKKAEGKILETTNCRYRPKKGGSDAVAEPDEYESKERRQELSKHFKRVANERHGHESVEGALKLPTLNMAETLHAIVLLPKTKVMKVAVGNGNAADNPFVTVDVPKIIIK